ncbi:MAG: hypothetical protein R6T90_02710 [Dissulfuribacterales bacterium]
MIDLALWPLGSRMGLSLEQLYPADDRASCTLGKGSQAGIERLHEKDAMRQAKSV